MKRSLVSIRLVTAEEVCYPNRIPLCRASINMKAKKSDGKGKSKRKYSTPLLKRQGTLKALAERVTGTSTGTVTAG